MKENLEAVKDQKFEFQSDSFQEFDFEAMEEVLNQDIEEMLVDLEALGEEKKLLTNPDSLGKEIYNSIFNQLGSQSGMDLSSDTLIEQYQKNHEGETLQSASREALTDKKYQSIRQKNTDASKSSGGIVDDYTGKTVKYSEGHQINTDHVVPRKEIYGEGFKKRLREMSGNEVKDLANLDENLKATNESLNKSKGAKSVPEYSETQKQREIDLKAQNERANEKVRKSNLSDSEKQAQIEKNDKRLDDKLAVDLEKMKVADKEARKSINKKVHTDTAKKVAKDAGKAALRAGIMQSAVTLVDVIIKSLVAFFKSKHKSWSEFISKMKAGISEFFKSLKKIFKSAVSGGVGSIVNNLMPLISETLGKVWGFIKTGFSTIKNAIKILTSPENKIKPLSIRLAEFGKVITAGFVATGAILLSESLTTIIETTFPALKLLTIPIIGSVTGLIVELILGIMGGIVTGIIINWLNKFIAGKQRSELNPQIIAKQNEILNLQEQQITVVEQAGKIRKNEVLDNIDSRHRDANRITKDALESIFTPLPETEYSFEDMQADLDSLL